MKSRAPVTSRNFLPGIVFDASQKFAFPREDATQRTSPFEYMLARLRFLPQMIHYERGVLFDCLP
jgi:hypothetical protein